MKEVGIRLGPPEVLKMLLVFLLSRHRQVLSVTVVQSFWPGEEIPE